MQTLYRPLTLAVLGVVSILTPGSARAPVKDTLKALSYSDLGKEIRALRGKPAIVYFWSFT